MPKAHQLHSSGLCVLTHYQRVCSPSLIIVAHRSLASVCTELSPVALTVGRDRDQTQHRRHLSSVVIVVVVDQTQQVATIQTQYSSIITSSTMSFFSAVGRFVSEFARFILFFASIIFLVGSSLLLVISSQGQNYFDVIDNSAQTGLWVVRGFSIYLIVLSILGVLASFFSSASTIRLLAFMTALNVILGVSVIVSSSSNFDTVHQTVIKRLTEYESEYDWNHKNGTSSEVQKATGIWDQIQTSFQCCGLKEPKDWALFRPKGHESENILPRSCCQRPDDTKRDGFCHADKPEDIWSEGCSSILVAVCSLISELVIAIICCNLVILGLATIVLCCNPYNSHSYGHY